MKKALALALAVLLALSLLSACSPSPSGSAPASKDPATSSPSGDPTTEEPTNPLDEVDFSVHETFSIWQQQDTNDYYSTYGEHPSIQFLNRKFNVTFEFEHPAVGAEADSKSLMMGTGEYTDIMSLNFGTGGSLSDLYEDGVIINVADYLDYMPNLKNLLETNPGFARNMYDDSGRIFDLKNCFTESELIWGGLVYRRDILETMTDGNVQFPSGNDEPTTIEDWDYMLPLMKQYFESAGMTEYAPLILPASGTFGFGELASGFGVSTSYYVEDGVVKSALMEDGFYNYLLKMREWYEKGYIYTDFASRTGDPFYFPNPALTYGGAAGIWYGLQSQLGDVMSMPDYGIFLDVQPLKNPLDTAHGITEAAPFSLTTVDNIQSAGYAVTTACENIPKVLAIIDYLYGEEGAMLRYGITKEQGADTDPICIKAGLTEGTYWFDDAGSFVINPLLTLGGGTVDADPFFNKRFAFYSILEYGNQYSLDIYKLADEVWGAYRDAKQKNMPSGIDRAADENKFTDNFTKMSDYQGPAFVNFILGTTELNEAAWNKYKEDMIALGANESLAIQQAAYDRFMQR